MEAGLLADRCPHSFLTSFYMFRLWFMTFFGEYRGEAAASHGDDHVHAVSSSRAGVSAPHGHGGIHESPPIMLIPLVILALLSISVVRRARTLRQVSFASASC